MNNVMFAWIRKEFTDSYRSGRMIIFLIVCFGIGLMNPIVAKLTPKLIELMQDQMAEMGMIYDPPEVTALTSWEQYVKNIWIPLLVFVLMFGNIFTKEYSAHTLTPMVTKGLAKTTVLWGKAILLILLWTAGYAVYFGVTLMYTEYYWGTEAYLMRRVWDMTAMFYLYSLFILALLVFFSVLWKEYSGVLVSMVAVLGLEMVFGMIPKIAKVIPGRISSPGMLLQKGYEDRYEYALRDFAVPLIVTLVVIVALFVLSTILMKRKSVD